MNDFNIHIRVQNPTPNTLLSKMKSFIRSIGGTSRTAELVGKFGSTEAFSKIIGESTFARTPEELQELMKNHDFVPIPTTEIKSLEDAEKLGFRDIAFVHLSSINKLGVSKSACWDLQQIVDNPKEPAHIKLIQVQNKLVATLGRIAFYERIYKTLIEKWSQPVALETAKKADDFVRQSGKILMTEDHYQTLLTTRTEGSTTIEANSKKLNDWLAADAIIRRKAEKKENLTFSDLCDINRIINGDDDEDIAAGTLRDCPSMVGGGRFPTTYPHHSHIPALLEQLLKEINDGLEKGENPVILAAKAYQRMVSIHPFLDGNGRTCRLVMDYVLIRSGLPPPALGSDVTIAIFGEQDNEPQTIETPTTAVEKVLAGVQKSIALLQ